MRRLAVIVVAVVLAGCGAAATPRPTPTPEPTPEPERTVEEKIAILEEGIHELYCDTEPISKWCAKLTKVDGIYRIEPLTEGSIYIYSTMKDSAKNRELAMTACKAIAASAHDPETAEPLGIRHFRVWDRTGVVELADCNFPDE